VVEVGMGDDDSVGSACRRDRIKVGQRVAAAHPYAAVNKHPDAIDLGEVAACTNLAGAAEEGEMHYAIPPGLQKHIGTHALPLQQTAKQCIIVGRGYQLPLAAAGGGAYQSVNFQMRCPVTTPNCPTGHPC